jgi:hypothetical protein
MGVAGIEPRPRVSAFVAETAATTIEGPTRLPPEAVNEPVCLESFQEVLVAPSQIGALPLRTGVQVPADQHEQNRW